MKKMTTNLLLASALIAPMMGCSDDENIVEQIDWDSSVTFFQSADEAGSDTYYKPAVGYVGDPMPFFDPVAKTFRIMYLQEFRPNQPTYHPFWCVETSDAANYVSLGELIPTGSINEQDAALGTGSTIYNEADKTYYTFYTGHRCNREASNIGEAVMYATSTDFKSWTKCKNFMLIGSDYGYSTEDFRDPCLFKGDDSKWHMIISTYKGNKGVLAEFVSSDLKTWQSAGEFMPMMWDRFYECPDIFKMGDWWYLIYNDKTNFMRRVQYFKGRTLDELKACTANDAGIWPDSHEGLLDSRGLYAGKTASDGTSRYLWGWCPTRTGNDNTNVGAAPNEPEWAGNLVAHRIIQHEDGTLSLGEIPTISDKYSTIAECRLMTKSNNVLEQTGGVQINGEGYALFSRLGVHNKISFTVKTSNEWDKFGISLVRGSDSEKYYTMVVNPENECNRKINFEEEGPEGLGFVAGIDGYLFQHPADNIYNVTIYTDNSVCVLYINDNVAYTNRIYGIQRNGWSINSYGGNIEVSNIKVLKY